MTNRIQNSFVKSKKKNTLERNEKELAAGTLLHTGPEQLDLY
jgi:hypothetical protein